jgi:hypothetical protein
MQALADIDMDVLRTKALKLKQKMSLTKYMLGFATVVTTALALPCMRVVLEVR